MRYATFQTYRDPLFKQFLIVSAVLHFSFVLIMTIKSFLFDSKTIEIPNSVKVDLIGLPDKIKEVSQPAPEPIPESIAEKPKVTESPKAEATKKINLQNVQKNALDKLKAQEALRKLKEEVAKKDSSAEPTPKVQQHRGNIISSGNSFTGMSRLRVNDYLASLVAQIQQSWIIPQWLNDADLKAGIVITIDERGYLIKKEIHTSSGNSVFDSSCLTAVSDASPFEPPPDEVRNALLMINFPFE